MWPGWGVSLRSRLYAMGLLAISGVCFWYPGYQECCRLTRSFICSRKRGGAQHLYHRPKGKDIDQQLRLIGAIIINGAQITALFFIIFRMLLIAGKMRHAPFQRIPFPRLSAGGTGSSALLTGRKR